MVMTVHQRVSHKGFDTHCPCKEISSLSDVKIQNTSPLPVIFHFNWFGDITEKTESLSSRPFNSVRRL